MLDRLGNMIKEDLLLTLGDKQYIQEHQIIDTWIEATSQDASLKTAKAIRDEFEKVWEENQTNKGLARTLDKLDSIIKEIENG
jgi:hypothetical protein